MVMNWIARFLKSGEMGVGSSGSEFVLWPVDANVDASSLGAMIDPPDLLQTELERARRHERCLCIVVLETRASPSEADPVARESRQRWTTVPQMRSMLAVAALRGMLRQTDVLCYQPAQDRCVLALTECTAEEAGRAIARIAGTLRERLNLSVRAGIARFPDDALTLGELLDGAVRATREEVIHGPAPNAAAQGERRSERRVRHRSSPRANGSGASRVALNGRGPHPHRGASEEGHDA